MTVPFFSVVIPLYNKENYITATLESVLGQTYTDFEVIVVNDASTDNSLKVAQRFTDSRVKFIIHPQNKGLSASRNTGIRNAQANYIAFIDADDQWMPQFLEKMHGLIGSYPTYKLFGAKYIEVYPEYSIEPDLKLSLQHETAVVDYFAINLQKSFFCFSGFCAKKEIFETSGYFDEHITFAEDIDFNIRAFTNENLVFYNKPLTYYNMLSQDQITQSGLRNKTIPDFNKYEIIAQGRPEIKKFLDFQRYILAKAYKIEADTGNYQRLVSAINPRNLNFKQRILLKVPAPLLRLLAVTKKLLEKRGLQLNSYS